MTDAEYQDIQGKCQKFIGIWKDRLWLQNWTIQPFYHRDGIDDHALGFVPAMMCHPDWRYVQAQIHINAQEIVEQAFSDTEIEISIVHELCHCLLDELSTEVPQKNMKRYQNHLERTITVLMNVLYAAYQE